MDYRGRQGSNANISGQDSDIDPWIGLIDEAHAYVDKLRRRRGLPPWNWNSECETVRPEGIAINIMADRTIPKSAEVAKSGLNTGADFARFMGALMGDLVEGNIEPAVAAAACKAGEKLLKVVEMQLRHGRENTDGSRTLRLTEGK